MRPCLAATLGVQPLPPPTKEWASHASFQGPTPAVEEAGTEEDPAAVRLPQGTDLLPGRVWLHLQSLVPFLVAQTLTSTGAVFARSWQFSTIRRRVLFSPMPWMVNSTCFNLWQY